MPYSGCQGNPLQQLHWCTFHCGNSAWRRVDWDWSLWCPSNENIWSLERALINQTKREQQIGNERVVSSVRNTWSLNRALIVSWCTACWNKMEVREPWFWIILIITTTKFKTKTIIILVHGITWALQVLYQDARGPAKAQRSKDAFRGGQERTDWGTKLFVYNDNFWHWYLAQ